MRLMTGCLRRTFRKTGERFLLILGERHMTRQAKHLKQLNGFVVYVGEDYQGAALFRDVDDAEQDRYADAVHELGVAEIDNQRARSGIKLFLALALDPLPRKLVEIVAGVNHRRGADAV